ncbi:MAG: zinc-binding dehydrogenase [Candidatus Latescibacterota bacterium]|nr:zinc-binding dehydrogenase [Candidatus Latescibacterota bacterium]
MATFEYIILTHYLAISMISKALVATDKQRFSIEEVVLPDPGPRQIQVQALYTGVSIGTEFALIQGKIHWGSHPMVTGYQGVGIVEQVGSDVSEIAVDDRVYYRTNSKIASPSGKKITGASGVHCAQAVTDIDGSHAAALLPEGADEEASSMFVMPAVGLNGVDTTNPRMGDVVVVYGVGLIGLGIVAACSHRGCSVIAADVEGDRLEIAKRMGADYAINLEREVLVSRVEEITPGGADVVFEATGRQACIDPAIALCRREGKFVLQGHYGDKPISYNFSAPHSKRLTIFYPCDDGMEMCRRAVLKNMAAGVLPWYHTITHRCAFEDSPQLFDAINQGRAETVLGAVIRWT